jgi:trehalose 6-phosphate phosphatase
MKPLFGAQGQAALAAALAHRPLLAFDFDGTLAPIVPLPDDARVAPAVAQRLQQLANTLPVAVITGRRIADVQARLGFEPRFVIGNHGAEDPAASDGWAHVRALDVARARLAAEHDALASAGVWVEDKGASIAVHYRHAADPVGALALVMRLVGPLAPALTIVGGKMVVNLMAADAPDKAVALAALVARSGAPGAIFVGDDVNDEPVFARGEPSWLTVRVGHAPGESAAMYWVDDTSGVATLLERMLALLPPP